MADAYEVELHDTDGQPVGRAAVTTVPDVGEVRADLHVEPGHLPPDTRDRLIDSVLQQPDVNPGAALTAVVPAGDGELIEKLHQATTDTISRRAGATTIVEGQLLPKQDLPPA